jgi:hypothetical protein
MSEKVDFTDEEIQKLLEQFDTSEKVEQFYYVLKLLIDEDIDEEEEVDFDEYMKRGMESLESKFNKLEDKYPELKQEVQSITTSVCE